MSAKQRPCFPSACATNLHTACERSSGYKSNRNPPETSFLLPLRCLSSGFSLIMRVRLHRLFVIIGACSLLLGPQSVIGHSRSFELLGSLARLHRFSAIVVSYTLVLVPVVVDAVYYDPVEKQKVEAFTNKAVKFDGTAYKIDPSQSVSLLLSPTTGQKLKFIAAYLAPK